MPMHNSLYNCYFSNWKKNVSQACLYMPLTPALERPRIAYLRDFKASHSEFQYNQSYVAKICLKNQTNKSADLEHSRTAHTYNPNSWEAEGWGSQWAKTVANYTVSPMLACTTEWDAISIRKRQSNRKDMKIKEGLIWEEGFQWEWGESVIKRGGNNWDVKNNK